MPSFVILPSPPEQARAVDQALTEEERTEAREEAEHSGKSAKYCLKEVRQSFCSIMDVPHVAGQLTI